MKIAMVWRTSGRRGLLKASRRPGFTLIELLIVIIIIAVVIAIVFPALGGARNAAKRAGTQTMFHDLGSASGQFILDNRRAPGYFSPTEMGDTSNVDRGFTGMENVMLELAGGMVPATTGGPIGSGPATAVLKVGPLAGKEVNVDVSQIGVQGGGTKSYWMPDRKMFLVQGVGGKSTTVANHKSLPDVVDPFGQPILAWTQDTTVPQSAAFASTDYVAAAPQQRARFYWASNAGFLRATALGKLAKTQSHTTNSVPHSLLGEGRSKTELEASMAGVLGNPAYPDATAFHKPSSARGTLIFHSAGTDGYFVGSTDRGGKLASANQAPWLPWSVGYNNPQPTAAGEAQQDAMDRFDDVLGKGDGSGG